MSDCLAVVAFLLLSGVLLVGWLRSVMICRLDVRNLQPITIALRFDPVAAAHLIDTPLSHDQQLHRENGFTTVTATVSDNAQLRWWLLDFWAQVEVLAPEPLRLEIAQKCHKMAQRYQTIQETTPC